MNLLHNSRLSSSVIPTAISAMAVTCQAEVRLPAAFGDHMVLQQKRSVPVWGGAKPGETVRVQPTPKTTHMQTHISNTLFSLTLACAAALPFRSVAAAVAESTEQRDARMAWFADARFGMFIHWGLYAIPSGGVLGTG